MLIIFDFDGTLVELEEMQNSAYDAILKEYGINFDMRTVAPGVPITEKIKMFRDMGYHLDEAEFTRKRDEWVVSNVENWLKECPETKRVIRKISEHHTVCIATNAGRPYVEKACEILGIKEYISKINTIYEFPPKPLPDMFMDLINKFPELESIIYEDSAAGITAAKLTPSIVEHVRNPRDTIERIKARYDI